MISPLWLFGIIFTYTAIVLLLWKGRTPERVAAIAMLLANWLSPLVDHLYIGNIRWAVGLVSTSLFLTFLLLSIRYARWWLLLAAGAQLLVLVTHVMTIIGFETLTWSLVSTRMTIWIEIVALAFFGAWEAMRAPYAHTPAHRASNDAVRITYT